MKRILISLLCLCLLCGCGAGSEETKSQEGFCFTDDLGRTVTVSEPKRVAVLLGSFAQVWLLAGGQVVAAPEDAWGDLSLELPDAVDLGANNALSLESLLSARPDFVLSSTNTAQKLEWKNTLESMGVPVAYFNIDDFDDYLRLLEICTDITGRKDLYETHGVLVQAQIEAVLSRKPEQSPKVLCMVASASSLRAKGSTGNVLGAMLHTMGCVNIADSDSQILEDLSIEQILLEDPEHIFIVQRGDDAAGMQAYVSRYFAEHPAWQQLTAVKEGRVHYMEKNLCNLKPNHRWGEAYEILEEILFHE